MPSKRCLPHSKVQVWRVDAHDFDTVRIVYHVQTRVQVDNVELLAAFVVQTSGNVRSVDGRIVGNVFPVLAFQLFIIKKLGRTVFGRLGQFAEFFDCHCLSFDVQLLINAVASFHLLYDRSFDQQIVRVIVIISTFSWNPFFRWYDLGQACLVGTCCLHLLKVGRKVFHLLQCRIENHNFGYLFGLLHARVAAATGRTANRPQFASNLQCDCGCVRRARAPLLFR